MCLCWCRLDAWVCAWYNTWGPFVPREAGMMRPYNVCRSVGRGRLTRSWPLMGRVLPDVFENGRSMEVSAVLWAILILCLMTLAYLVFVPDERQKKLKENCDKYSAEVLGQKKFDEFNATVLGKQPAAGAPKKKD